MMFILEQSDRHGLTEGLSSFVLSKLRNGEMLFIDFRPSSSTSKPSTPAVAPAPRPATLSSSEPIDDPLEASSSLYVPPERRVDLSTVQEEDSKSSPRLLSTRAESSSLDSFRLTSPFGHHLSPILHDLCFFIFQLMSTTRLKVV